ncbi:hypothetical protein EVAR_99795_1 [Eumeta japonica]|uniref:Uncharacterized protein n=1 Tax=Eumeta variegata TaxID=151549 RepID=A0A4C1ZEU1_EUMVA|nr:hypothetical protein EVAR_99795_1 [Eumeta japonica]
MSGESKDNSDTSESEVSVCSSTFDPLKALYSSKTKVPVENAPMYENIKQFESAMSGFDVSSVGSKELVKKREQEREAKLKAQKEVEEKNRQRFSHLQGRYIC